MPARMVVFIEVLLCILFSILPVVHVNAVTFNPVSIDMEHPIIGDAFHMEATGSGAVAGAIYFLKCRIGPTSSSLTEGQTYNATFNGWLDDTSAWVDMPTVTVREDGSWNGTLSCRIKISAVDESKVLFVRAYLKSNDACGASFQSSTFLTLSPIAPTVTCTPVPTQTPTNTPTKIPTDTPVSMSTPYVAVQSMPTPKPTSYVKIIATVLAEPDVLSTDGAVLGEQIPSIASNTPPVHKGSLSITILLIAAVLLAVAAAVLSIKIQYTKKT